MSSLWYAPQTEAMPLTREAYRPLDARRPFFRPGALLSETQLAIFRSHLPKPMATHQTTGPTDYIVYVQDAVTPHKDILWIFYNKDRESVPVLLAKITWEKYRRGNVRVRTIAHEEMTTRTNLPVETLKSPEWQAARVAAIHAVGRDNLIQALKTGGKEGLEALLFCIQALNRTMEMLDEYDKYLVDAIATLSKLPKESNEQRILYNTFARHIEVVMAKRADDLSTARWSIVMMLGLDVATYGAKWVLKPVTELMALVFTRLGKIGVGLGAEALAYVGPIVKNRWDLLTSVKLGTESTARSVGATLSAISSRVGDGFSYISRKFSTAWNKLGANIFVHMIFARAKLALNFSTRLLEATKMGIMTSSTNLVSWMDRFPKTKHFFDVSDTLRFGRLDYETKRLYYMGLGYSVMFQTANQAVLRWECFTDELDQVGHDIMVSMASGLTVGRLTVGLDKFEQRNFSWFERWRQRQFTSHMVSFFDVSTMYYDMLDEAGEAGLSEQDIEFLRRRMIANLSYTLTRGPFVGSVTSLNNGGFNKAIIDAKMTNDTHAVIANTFGEFFSRGFNSMASWGIWLKYREDFSRVDQHDSNLDEKMAEAKLLEQFQRHLESQEQIALAKSAEELERIRQDGRRIITLFKSGETSSLPEIETNEFEQAMAAKRNCKPAPGTTN